MITKCQFREQIFIITSGYKTRNSSRDRKLKIHKQNIVLSKQRWRAADQLLAAAAAH
jgi:hypothetical protein